MEWKNEPTRTEIDEHQGFIYCITHQPTGRFYIGSKTFWNKTRTYHVRKPNKTERDRLERYKKNHGPAGEKTLEYKALLKDRYAGLKKVSKGLKESSWRTYTGSNKQLNEEIALNGPGEYTKEILYLCKDKFELAYFELKEQLKRDVLFNPLAFNEIINVRLRRRK